MHPGSVGGNHGFGELQKVRGIFEQSRAAAGLGDLANRTAAIEVEI
jgi:hypothetical protein